MKKVILPGLMLLWGVLYVLPVKVYSQTNQKENKQAMETNQSTTGQPTTTRIFIDRFMVPQTARQEFMERMTINRNLIKTLPGFIEDAAYERTDEQGNLVVVTVVVWASEEAIAKAKEVVQASYKKEGFNLPAMLERLNITMMERGVYTKMEE